MKPTKIKAWPELVGFMPSLPVFREWRPKTASGAPVVEVDFGSVRDVSATGLTVFLLRLFRLLGERRCPQIRQDCDEAVRENLSRLGAFDLIQNMAGTVQHELALASESPGRIDPHPTDSTRIPVQRLNFGCGEDRRYRVRTFKKWLAEQLSREARVYDLQPSGITMLLGEIAKNAADHSSSDAYFGLDIVPIEATKAHLTFAFGDLGIGIKKHIEKHLPEEEERRRRHWSLYESYRLALKPGYTSNRSTHINKGHGMSIIVDCAAALGVHLSIFDASSRGLLSCYQQLDTPSHSAIRRIFHNVGHDVGFFYYGELVLNRKRR